MYDREKVVILKNTAIMDLIDPANIIAEGPLGEDMLYRIEGEATSAPFSEEQSPSLSYDRASSAPSQPRRSLL